MNAPAAAACAAVSAPPPVEAFKQHGEDFVVADNLNQSPITQQPNPPAPQDPLGWCPQTVNNGGSEHQTGTNSANNLVGAGIQNPLNPYGCRLQTLWREIDLSLSRTDAFDFNPRTWISAFF